MNWHRVLTAFVALVALGIVAAVVYLETANSGGAAATTTNTTGFTVPSATMAPTTTSTTTLPPTTLAPTTTVAPATTMTPTTVTPTTLPPDRAAVPVVVSSGPSNGQRLVPGAFLIGSVGWTDIRPLNGSTPLTESVVFFVDGMQAAAELLAVDAGLPATSVAPIDQAPPVAGLANAQLLFYFGGA